jgi:SnoaL-like polyketide cyclase
MSKVEQNKALVGRWFTEFWGPKVNLSAVDELAAPDMLLQYSLHEPRHGREDIKAFITEFRAAFPDLNFWGTADLIAEGDYVVGRWEGGGTHTGPAFGDFLTGSLPLIVAERCISPESLFCASRMERSLRKLDWMTVSQR